MAQLQIRYSNIAIDFISRLHKLLGHTLRTYDKLGIPDTVHSRIGSGWGGGSGFDITSAVEIF